MVREVLTESRIDDLGIRELAWRRHGGDQRVYTGELNVGQGVYAGVQESRELI